jgi:N utilization substance protein A
LSLVEAQELAGDEIEIGDMLQIPLPQEEMGRIAAQTAKQILVQKVREAIREKVYEEYVDRKGELINGTVKRFERGDMIIDLGNNLEAIVPKREQSRGEMWNQGERIRVAIVDVTKDQKGQQIKVSRASSELIKRLFEMEVPRSTMTPSSSSRPFANREIVQRSPSRRMKRTSIRSEHVSV